MKRVLALAVIAVYIGILIFGNTCHLLRFGVTSHPWMYMIVWDMFCGWTAFDSRTHIIGEADNGKYYDLSNPPYDVLHPYGYIARENYDVFNNHTGLMGLNVLKHTRHEPVSRVFVVEECWAKKYNLPDHVWNLRYDDPKDNFRYHRMRVVMLPDGSTTHAYNSWVAFQGGRMMVDNPRLVELSRMSQPMFINEISKPGRELLIDPGSVGFGMQSHVAPTSAASGN